MIAPCLSNQVHVFHNGVRRVVGVFANIDNVAHWKVLIWFVTHFSEMNWKSLKFKKGELSKITF